MLYFVDVEAAFRTAYANDFDNASIDGSGALFMDYVCRELTRSFEGRPLVRSMDSDDIDFCIKGLAYGVCELDKAAFDWYQWNVVRENLDSLLVTQKSTNVSEETPNNVQAPFISDITPRSINSRNQSKMEMGNMLLLERLSGLKNHLHDKIYSFFYYAFLNRRYE